jgi:hypothetical protein
MHLECSPLLFPSVTFYKHLSILSDYYLVYCTVLSTACFIRQAGFDCCIAENVEGSARNLFRVFGGVAVKNHTNSHLIR